MILMFATAALAGGIHAGIPVRGVEGLGEPTFLTPASGWSAAVEGGWVRVFVGATEAEGAEWYTRALESIGNPPAPLVGFPADEAHGDGATLVAFRDGNVGVLVRAERDAGNVATRLHTAIVEAAPVVVPSLRPSLDETWIVEAPGAAAVRAVGGGAVPFQAHTYKSRPTEVYVWDAWGRVTVLTE